jgi:hypothetical protein
MAAALSRVRLSIIAAALLLALAGTTPAARADILDLPGTGCGQQQLSQPFAQWGDNASYVLVPGGTFERGNTPWTLTGPAQTVADNEPWYVNSPGDRQALSLPSGSSATSPATCASLASPTIRLFATSSGGSLLSLSYLQVTVLFRTNSGDTGSLPIGVVLPSGQWGPTPAYVSLLNNAAPVSTDFQALAFQFTPVGDANWEIDDVYQDPWSKG